MAATSAACSAPPAVEYTVSLPAPETQMVDVMMEVPGVASDTLEVALPVWRPGKYQILDPAGTIRDVRAFDDAGDPLPIRKVEKSVWRIEAAGAESVRIDYRIYANSLADRTRHVDETHAFLSGSTVFMFVVGQQDRPAVVRFEAPVDWRIASGLEAHPTIPRALMAPNYHVLVDSPLEVGEHDLIEFEVDAKPHEIVIWGDAGEYDGDRLIRDFTAIIETQKSIWGDLPYERYVLIVHAGRGGGGGTEHLNSTIMQTSTAALEGSMEKSNDAYRRFLGLVSHEFFHTWNVKQLRPAGIHPYDYLRENYTDLLWVAEGTTSYYDDLTLARAGLIDEKRYFDVLARFIDSDRRRPGSRVQPLAESSFDAWIKFSRSTPDDVNSTVSFYDKGALVSFALDMEIRARTANAVSLDAVLREMYQRFPLEGLGYTTGDFIDTIESLTQSGFDAWFAAHVDGVEPINAAAAAATVGLELYFDPASDADQNEDEPDEGGTPGDAVSGVAAAEGADHMAIPLRATLGINLSGATIRSVLSTGSAYDAGLRAGDELVAINGQRIASSSDVDEALEDLEPGDVVKVAYFRHDVLRTIEITLAGEPDGEWKIRRAKEPTEAQKMAYESWIGQPWPGN